MKGTILVCLQQMIIADHGEAAWRNILEAAKVPAPARFLATGVVEDDTAMALFKACEKVLGLTPEEFASCFGTYWINEFAASHYPIAFKAIKNAKDFLKWMDHLHQTMTQDGKNITPPRFNVEDKDTCTLVMRYESKRKLIHLMVGMIEGVGKYCGESMKVTLLAPDSARVEFRLIPSP